MTGAFDEWALARTPALLVFAAALVDDREAADAAVARVLARMREGWSRSTRDDPDLEARRLVVRLCSTPRRAAVVLRVLERRTDAEIADLLHCSESAVRGHLRRGLADRTHPGAAASAHGLRDDVAAPAGSAPTQLLTRPAQPAAPATRRGPRGPWLTAVAVLALVGGVAYASHESRSRGLTYPRTPVPSSWRYESYAGVQVQVPGHWGWGASPIRGAYFRAPAHLGACGTASPSITPSEGAASYAAATPGFVGRPAMVTERCVSWGSDGTTPTGDAVWFDSPFPLGQKQLGSTVAETREVRGQHVTAFSARPALRRQILGTATEVAVDAHGCPTRPVTAPVPGPRDPEASSMSVCVYSQDTGASTLLYSTRLAAGPARAYAARVAAAAPVRGSTCGTPSGRWVALGLWGPGAARWDVVDLGCDAIRSGSGRTLELTPDLVRGWAVDGIPAYVAAPPGGDQELRRLLRAPTA
jgi:hypothetical protein